MSTSMILRVPCTACGRSLRLKSEDAGRKAKCPCGRVLVVPSHDSSDFSVVLPAPARPKRPAALDAELAEEIVREVATRCKAKQILKQLGKIKPAVVANARADYAEAMDDDERPLAVVDDSFLQNGKSGLLLTNRCVYSSNLKRPIPLADVLAVVVETPTPLQAFLAGMFGILFLLFYGRLKNRLLVNGYMVFEGNQLHPVFWKDALAELARELRADTPVAAVPRSKPRELLRIAATAICAGHDRDRILDDLEAAGHPPGACLPLVDDLLDLYETPRRGALPFVLVAVGVVFAGLGLGATSASRGQFLWYGPIVFGVGLALFGVARLIRGSPALTTQQLIDAHEVSAP
jgi:hypothetical protein